MGKGINNFPIAKEGFSYILVLAVLSITFYFVLKPVFVLSLILLLFVLFFFRNPNRKIPDNMAAVVSPTDGRVMLVSEVYETEFIGAKAFKVTIFLSIFNVHINRSPIDGIITYVKYRPGKYFPAFKSHASEMNERNSVGIENETLKVLVHQITGFIARRIVCRVDKGDSISKGQRYGMIKFGSCTEIIVPMIVDLKIKAGDKVKAGCSVIGVLKS